LENSEATLPASRYVIYARKSTDDPQKQARSIADQIRECEELAQRLNLTVVDDPIVEEISAKKPKRRPGFIKLIKRIESGEINGVIAWHPDRLARNMTEGGDLIQLIDDGKILDMQFVSFPFSNDASGKMLLGISFALSKHYSDKLSTDIRRGLISNLQEGKSAGHYKPGYYRDPNTGFYHRDKKNYDIVEKAWDMKLAGETETNCISKIFHHFKGIFGVIFGIIGIDTD
jgi:site-specific DNA recombinase